MTQTDPRWPTDVEAGLTQLLTAGPTPARAVLSWLADHNVPLLHKRNDVERTTSERDRLRTDFDGWRRSITAEVQNGEDRAGRFLADTRAAEALAAAYLPVVTAADTWADARIAGDPAALAAAVVALLQAVAARRAAA